MDLSETRAGGAARHPWEVARAEAIIRVLGRTRKSFATVLDYGCGDGFSGREVQRAFGASALAGIDVHLPEASCGLQHVDGKTVELTRDEATLGERRFELVLLCDVIEHVHDAEPFLRGIIERRVAPGGLLLLTVPAFQILFSSHDRALRHYRRYSLRQLRETVSNVELDVVESGYLFASLLAARGLGKLGELVRKPTADAEFGVGGWQRGPLLTRWVTRALSLDNSVLLGARRMGLTLPGLSAWALCKTR
jgi:2-polyprenyl-3-methyl-5-hydroxy-6-metoxy-1,4-benzoquinol methylase